MKKEVQKRLKVQALRVENDLNETIKNSLNNEMIYRILGKKSEKNAEKLRSIREQVEVLSLQYNFPTKNDVANLAKLLIQIEEKIDKLEEKMINQNKSLPSKKQNCSSSTSTILIENAKYKAAIVSNIPGLEEELKRLKDVKVYDS
ncbi:hypothetical protein FIU87_17125 [Bacillus sp. THAF10]|uniref:hypothetical protein n=1 Tax=Bacillus sp. THAF10 TaxID=2587848 RepID=UPI001268C4AD|nr:hypothetical protein [Bacillus sp. THAF10]QFT90365.1 hypothetical protein FIU87_17125 [Bacillus sp. THAF10]